MSSCTNRVLRDEIYIATRRDRRSRDCFDARVIAPSFVDPAMDLSAIGTRRHPHHPPKGFRKMRWILISTSGGNGRNRKHGSTSCHHPPLDRHCCQWPVHDGSSCEPARPQG